MEFKPLIQNIKFRFLWLWRGKFHILSISTILITVLYLFKVIIWNSSIVSLFMTILGLLLIYWQLSLDAKQFADHNPNTIFNWIKAYSKNKIIHLKARDITTASPELGHPYLSGVISENDPLDKKVNFLLRENDNLHMAIKHVNTHIEKVEKTIVDRTGSIEKDVASINRSLKSIIAGHVIGAYDITLFGIVSTLCGVLIQYFCY